MRIHPQTPEAGCSLPCGGVFVSGSVRCPVACHRLQFTGKGGGRKVFRDGTRGGYPESSFFGGQHGDFLYAGDTVYPECGAQGLYEAVWRMAAVIVQLVL